MLNYLEIILNKYECTIGYDVWLGNARGNDYSRKHSFLNPSGEAYWRFSLDNFLNIPTFCNDFLLTCCFFVQKSWDEMGQYDIPAEINYVLAAANNGKTGVIFSLNTLHISALLAMTGARVCVKHSQLRIEQKRINITIFLLAEVPAV